MSGENTATAIREAIEAFGRGDLEGAVAPFADDAEYNEFGTGQTYKGKAQIRAANQGWMIAFPDAKAEVKTQIVTGDEVALEVVWRGTHTGPLQSPAGTVPATGRRVEVPSAIVATMRGGKVQSQRQYFNLASLMQQLGLAG